MKTQRCPKCERHLPEEGYYPSRWGKRGLWCRECEAKAASKYVRTPVGRENSRVGTERFFERRRQRVVAYLGGVCTHPGCGQTYIEGLHNGDSRKLECHHIDPATKLFTIMNGVNLSKKWSVIQAECDKCVLLCQKHHDEVHASPLSDAAQSNNLSEFPEGDTHGEKAEPERDSVCSPDFRATADHVVSHDEPRCRETCLSDTRSPVLLRSGRDQDHDQESSRQPEEVRQLHLGFVS